jgi:hypothetical protein
MSPLEAGALIAFAIVGGLIVGYLIVERVLRHGGRPLAVIAAIAGVAGLMSTITPGLLPGDLTLVVGVGGLIVCIRPIELIRGTGGPRPEWEALRVGRELQVIVAEAGGPMRARHDPAIADRVASLAAVVEVPATADYLRLVRRTILADPTDPLVAADLQQLAEADAMLRSMMRVAPAWERSLAERAETAGASSHVSSDVSGG